MRPVLFATSVLTFLSCGWLALMECLLRHPGFPLRCAEDILLALVPLASLWLLWLHGNVRYQRWLWPAAVALIAVGLNTFVRNARSASFEGFVLIISLLLLIQGAMMLAALGHANP